jgi:TrmH family RNA methyltransferase
VGESLVFDRIREARRQRLVSLHLLTVSAAGWFPRFGFREVPRDEVPGEIRGTGEFSVHCPSTATVMELLLASPLVFVLVRPQFTGNLGMICRAATAFGFADVRIVQPALDLEKPEGRWFAHGAEETLDAVGTFASLDEALHDCHRAVATTARRRHWNRALREPAEMTEWFAEASAERKLALVFGPEDHGLSNEDMARCDALVSIPRPPAISASLSLPASATILAWEAARARGATLAVPARREVAVARSKRRLSTGELTSFVEQVAVALEGIGLKTQPDAVRFRGTLRDFFARAQPTEADRVFLRHLVAQLSKWKRAVLGQAPRGEVADPERSGSPHGPQ